MPTARRLNGYRFYFRSHPNEPPHVHVDKGGATLKAWLDPVAFARASGFRSRGIKDILGMVVKHRGMLLEARHEYSGWIADARVADSLIVDLMDGRTIIVPLAWYPRLLAATPDQRAHWEKAGGGHGIHWPEVDEDLSTEGLLRGAPAPKAA